MTSEEGSGLRTQALRLLQPPGHCDSPGYEGPLCAWTGSACVKYRGTGTEGFPQAHSPCCSKDGVPLGKGGRKPLTRFYASFSLECPLLMSSCLGPGSFSFLSDSDLLKDKDPHYYHSTDHSGARVTQIHSPSCD